MSAAHLTDHAHFTLQMRRIKLNNKVTFPHVLDMNIVLDGYVPRPVSDEELEDQELDYKRRVQQQIERALMHGPYVYELYAVLVHRGSALGGHYYAYIKVSHVVCSNNSVR